MARFPNVKNLSCPRCGAPLRWRGEASVVECQYCQTHVVVTTGQPTSAPAGAVAGRKIVPQLAPLVIAGFAGLMVLGVASAAVIARFAGERGGAIGPRRATPVEIAATPLAATQEVIARRFGATAAGNGVSVPLAGGAFESVRFSWDPAQLDHVSMISLTAREAGVPPEVLERARAQLGSALRPAGTGGHQYNGEGVNLSISSNLYINAHEFEDPRWKGRLAALFTVLRGAALGTSDVLDERSRRDVLNLGYPLLQLAQVAFDVSVDGAALEVRRVFPGAVSTKQRHDVGLGHAWFSSAMLQWENAPNGKWQSVHLHYPASFDFKAQRAALERCLSAMFGAPKVDVTDHLAGEITLRFESAKAMLRVYAVKQSVMLFPVRGAKTDTSSSGLRQAIETLASCG